MKITLINLATKDEHAFVNLGALYIAAAVREKGYTIDFIDLVRYPLGSFDIIERIRKFSPDLLAFSGIVTTYYQFELLSNLLKESFRNIPQIVGGSISSVPFDIFHQYTKVDFVVKGEGEVTILKMLKQLERENRWSEVPNIFIRDESGFKASTTQDLVINDIDTIPFPAYDLIDVDFYMSYNVEGLKNVLGTEGKPNRFLPMIFSRGCPYSCSFCYRLIKRWRHHSDKYILSQLKMLREKYDIYGVTLFDELVFVNRKWFINTCEAIASSDLKFKFATGGGKPNLVTEEVIIAMKKAGFRRIGYGLETGSPQIIELMRKKVTVRQNLEAVKLTFKHGLISQSNFVFGHFGEDRVTVKETLKFMNDLVKLQDRYKVWEDSFQIWFATPYPGTYLYEYAKEKKLITDEREYISKVTIQQQKYINLSQFKSVNELHYTVNKGLYFIYFKKFLRRKQYKEAVIQLFQYVDYVLGYYFSLGVDCRLSDRKWVGKIKRSIRFAIRGDKAYNGVSRDRLQSEIRKRL